MQMGDESFKGKGKYWSTGTTHPQNGGPIKVHDQSTERPVSPKKLPRKHREKSARFLDDIPQGFT